MSGPTHDPSLYRSRDLVPVRRALLSVSDKTGLLEMAAALADAGVEMVSTGSTANTIRDAGFPVTEVADVTGFAEALDGRVKTLHPGIHAGLLADLRLAHHEAELERLGIAAFELVVVNLYPFVETVASGAPAANIVEQIDIGGPAMVRASAKNHANVAIAVSPDSYPELMAAVRAGGTTLAQRQRLAALAFAHTASYDIAVASWMNSVVATDSDGTPAPRWMGAAWQREAVLRYGENAHQSAALYGSPNGRGIAQATQLHGKEMSFNNYVDADAAIRAAYDFDGQAPAAVAIIKHANPCGIAVADTVALAHERAHACDPLSAFGGVIATNVEVSPEMAATVADIFTEVVVAPAFHPEAFAILSAKKNIRLLQLPADFEPIRSEVKQISGGVLLQDADRNFADPTDWTLVAGPAADSATIADLSFAWRAVRAVKSNAILLADHSASVGIGMGQVNRVDSCRLAVERAGGRASGSVAASDAFFPFADGVHILIDAGVRAIVQPGGSIRDEEVIAAAESAGVSMYFTNERHFFH
ncbi:MAG TPA: bifunctional phosphoribosylaminoimidazolecarboxamide formyltransferase/IMP cyclohydrolase [Microbacteriaceae bacterium]|nr:bifunctional phosphoribosylaminoimidazolecarboxamide formyltransferase/IMP cyclohydrolase [Microbacteriaceae bacterium]